MGLYNDGRQIMSAGEWRRLMDALPDHFRNETLAAFYLGGDVDRAELSRAFNIHARFAAPEVDNLIDTVVDRLA